MNVYLYQVKDFVKLDCSDKKLVNCIKSRLMREVFRRVEDKLRFLKSNIIPGMNTKFPKPSQNTISMTMDSPSIVHTQDSIDETIQRFMEEDC